MSEPERPHSVVGGVLKHVSVSQVTTFDDRQFGGCARKWYYEKVQRRPRVETKSQAVGKALHAEIEHYLLTGEDVLGPLARAGKRFLPAPMVHLLVEYPLDKGLLTAAGVPFEGVVDVVNESGYYLTDEGELLEDECAVEVVDWKSTASMEYAKPAAALRDTVQMPTYVEAMRRLRSIPDDARARISHGNFVTRGRAFAEKRTTSIEIRDVRSKWQDVVETVERMKVAARAPRAEDVPASTGSCGAYRGCPHRSYCTAGADALWSSMFADENAAPSAGKGQVMSLLSRFAVQVQAPATPALSEEVKAEVAALKAEEASASVRFTGVNPPDATVSRAPHSAEPVSPELLATMPPTVQEAAKAFLATPPPADPVAAAADEPPKTRKKRTTRPSTPATPVEQDPHGTMPIAVVDGLLTSDEGVTSVVRNASVIDGILLFVDAEVEGIHEIKTRDLEFYVRDMLAKIEGAFKVDDVRCAPDGSPLAYGKWKGVLAAGVRANPPAPGAYRLTDVRESEAKQVVVAELRPLCAVFVRGRAA